MGAFPRPARAHFAFSHFPRGQALAARSVPTELTLESRPPSPEPPLLAPRPRRSRPHRPLQIPTSRYHARLGLIVNGAPSQRQPPPPLLRPHSGELFETSSGRSVLLGSENVIIEDCCPWVHHHGWTIHLPPGATLRWPQFGCNPYRGEPDDALAYATGLVAWSHPLFTHQDLISVP